MVDRHVDVLVGNPLPIHTPEHTFRPTTEINPLVARFKEFFPGGRGCSARRLRKIERPVEPTSLPSVRLAGSELLTVVLLILAVWALFDTLRTSSDVWAASRQTQAVWVLIVLLLPFVGPILYFLIARPRLNEVR